MKCEGFSKPCGKYRAVKTLQNTRFAEEERNYNVLCPKCQLEADKYWAEMWREYWTGCL
jgi:hypothetical protein